MAKLIALRGIQGSGKSTWAKEQVDKGGGKVKRVNNDELRLMLDNGNWSPDNENVIFNIRRMIIKNLLDKGYTVIVYNMNLTKNHIKELSDFAKECSTEFEIKEFALPLEECIRRDALRPNPIGEEVIRKTYNGKGDYVAKLRGMK